MFALLTLAFASLIIVSSGTKQKQEFTTPSQAYAFVEQPLADVDDVARRNESTKLSVNRRSQVTRRAKTWCPVFAIDNQSGEELYFLALLCRDALDSRKAKISIEQYLAQERQPHGPEARLLLALLYRQLSEPDKAWQTCRAMLEADPIKSSQSVLIASLIEDEENEARALEWSRERYSILANRARNAPEVSPQSVVLAGIDLVHRYYLLGENHEAHTLLEELHQLNEAHRDEIIGFASEGLHWADMEMRPAPPIPIQKLLSRAPVSEVIKKGRVEILSFFFLGCAPCISELPALNDLQKRYKKKGLLVADVTTYKANSYQASTPSEIEVALNKICRTRAPDVSMVVTSDETMASYGIHAFPVIMVIDKSGRLRYTGKDIDFDGDQPIVGRLVLKLIAE